MRVRKKPVEVEAMKLHNDNIDEVAQWCNALIKVRDDNLETYLCILTLEGTMSAYVGDWIIKGVKGEFYPCKDDIFHKTYDIIVESSPATRGLKDRIYVESVIEHKDGSATINIDLDHDLLPFFAKIGLQRVITEAAEEILKDDVQ